MDIHPIQPGTVVVVSKTQIENFYELNDADYTALWVTIKKIAKQMKIVFPVKKRIAVKIEGLDVAHAHATVFPIDSGEEFRAEQDTDSEPDHQMLADLAAKLAIPITSV
jgi:histidine triad (HIT) family protein